MVDGPSEDSESLRLLTPSPYSPPTAPTVVTDTASVVLSLDSELDLQQQMIDQMNYLQEPETTPHGRHLGVFAMVMMILQRIIGSGIFAVPALIYRDLGGSPALFFAVWLIAGYVSFAGLFCFLELGKIIPRSGGMKVFLEYIYYKPRMLMSVLYNTYSIAFGFTITNAIIFGEYTLYSLGWDDVNGMAPKYIGCVYVVLCCVVVGVSTNAGVRVSNITGALKLVLLAIMSLTGVYVLVLPTSVTGVTSNLHWHDFFKQKREITLASFISAILKATFSFGGWHTAHIVTNEIKDPVRTLAIAGPLALLIVNVSYFFLNLSYLIVIPDSELASSGEMVGSLLYEKLFGYTIGRQCLTMTVAVSSAGNIFTVMFHLSRMNQEIFREGFLPFSRFFASNWPFGAPLRALVFPLVISCFFLLIPTPDNVYDYIINLESYPLELFLGLTVAGIFVLKRRIPDYQYPNRLLVVHAVVTLALAVFLVVAPLNPFKPSEFVGFPNYAYTAVSILLLCVLYWAYTFVWAPHWGHYTLYPVQDTLSDGLVVKRWEKKLE
ncbi:hypothetical protein OGAPHI_001020 [Ogataea philodendri]|uniref:Low-affinity methionine permease n=1 Tax=Ogataea philodendri TaxID=1378263 RepID=A0A9P8T9P2_9ASCO|nr:uncharacterized protein OGAPHI_001020 [Ogataea philodendri]KAH3670505.1 hypothetical protein OGAPHI_001020 [Ogataea philodendri]